MTDDTMPLAVESEETTLPQPEDYFDGNEQELPEPDEDLDDETTSEDDEQETDESEDTEEQAEEEEASAAEPETVEVEFNGKKYKVPSELKDGFLMQGDYTRKTQEVAAKSKAVDAERQQVQQMAQMTQEEIGALVDLRGIDAQLQQYQQVNWQQLYQEDFIAAQQHRAMYDDLKDKRASALQTYQQASGKRTEQAEQMTATRLRETAQYAQKNIPNWTPELDAEITSYAESKGFDRDTLKASYTPAVYEMIYKAFMGEQFLAKQAAVKPKPVQTPKKPLTKVPSTGATAGKKSLYDMEMNEFAAERDRQERAKAQRRR